MNVNKNSEKESSHPIFKRHTTHTTTEMDLHHLHHPFNQTAAPSQEIYADLKKTQADLASMTNKHMAAVAKHAADLEKWTQKHQKIQTELDHHRESSKASKSMQSELAEHKEMVRALKARNEEIAAKGLAYKTKHSELEAENKALRAKSKSAASADKTVESLQDNLAKLKTHASRVECQHAALSEQIESFRAAKKQHDLALSQLTTKHENLKAAKNQADLVNSKLHETIVSLKSQQKPQQVDHGHHQLLKNIDKVLAVCSEYHAQSESPLSDMLTTTRQNLAVAVRSLEAP